MARIGMLAAHCRRLSPTLGRNPRPARPVHLLTCQASAVFGRCREGIRGYSVKEVRLARRRTARLAPSPTEHGAQQRAGERRMNDSSTVLIIEDDRKIAALVARYLAAAGFAALQAHDGEAGLRLAQGRGPCLVIVDLMLPGLDGWAICQALRETSDVPIVILSAREDEADRVLGFSLGADDYVVKPFSPRELVERVKAILRRSGQGEGRATPLLRSGGLVLEPDKCRVTLAGNPVAVTPSELCILRVLMSAPGRVFSRSELLGRLHDRGQVVVERVIDVHIGKLRHKLEDNPANPRFILTVHGLGYRFADAGDVPATTARDKLPA
jgi:DNA-binding response OmpR family regulator